jgi:hypothetical protein
MRYLIAPAWVVAALALFGALFTAVESVSAQGGILSERPAAASVYAQRAAVMGL